MLSSFPSLSQIGLRVALVVVGLGLWFWSQSLIAKKAECSDGIGDWLHQRTAGWHGWLLANPRSADRLLIVSSLWKSYFNILRTKLNWGGDAVDQPLPARVCRHC